MNYFSPKVKMAAVAGLVTVGLDLSWHLAATNPMETFDYFVVKGFLGFLVATVFLNWRVAAEDVSNMYNWRLVLWAAAGFSFLMSLYYRWWEYFSGVPFSVRAPDIVFVDRGNVILFGGVWFLAHGLFFLIGTLVARSLARRS